jgi:hypothetical protein
MVVEGEGETQSESLYTRNTAREPHSMQAPDNEKTPHKFTQFQHIEEKETPPDI